jgi:hypothetical protein
MKVFFVLNIVTLLLVAYLHIAVVRSPFMLYPYVLYLFVISLPSLIFMLGLPCCHYGSSPKRFQMRFHGVLN